MRRLAVPVFLRSAEFGNKFRNVGNTASIAIAGQMIARISRSTDYFEGRLSARNAIGPAIPRRNFGGLG